LKLTRQEDEGSFRRLLILEQLLTSRIVTYSFLSLLLFQR
jgi:hypothetical protein